MNTATVIRRIERSKPTTAQEILDNCELPLQYIGGGAYRDTYHVIGTSVVIKVPRTGPGDSKTEQNIQHSRDEFKMWHRIRKSKRKFRPLRKYLPEIIYYNSTTGIMVCRKYEKAKRNRSANALIVELEQTVTTIMGTTYADIHYGNLAVDKAGKFRIIDMGLFIAGKI